MMFCSKCGKEIEDDALFCFSCGARVPDRTGVRKEHSNVVEEKKLIEIFPNQTTEEFNIYGEILTFGDGDFKCIKMIQEFIKCAEKQRNKVLEYQLEIENISDMSKFREKVDNCFFYFLDTVVVGLRKNNITCLSSNAISNQLYDGDTFGIIDEFERKAQQKIRQLQEDKEEQFYYNAMRKESRMKLVGGGFGVKGAVKGIATASAINAVTGAFYSVGNAFSAMSINAKYRNAVAEIEHMGLGGEISESFYDACMECLDGVFSKIEEKGYYLKYTTSNKNKAEGIYNSFCDTKDERAKKEFCKWLSIFPVDEKGFIAICSEFGDDNGEIKRLCEKLGMDVLDIEKAIMSYEYHEKLIGTNNGYHSIEERIVRLMYHDEDYYNLEELESWGDQEYLELVKADMQYNNLFYMIENPMTDFVESGINYYLEEDYYNTPLLFVDELKDCMHKCSGDFYSFAYGKNLELLRNIKNISFDNQQPMCLIWRRNLDGYVDELNDSYLLITSEYLYRNDHQFPIMDIYSIDFDEKKKSAVINESVTFGIAALADDRTLATVLYTIVLLLQLYHEWGEKDKIIPLLSMEIYGKPEMQKKYNKPVKNIYWLTRVRYLNEKGVLNRESYFVLNRLHNYLYINGYDRNGNYSEDYGKEYIAKTYHVDSDENYIIIYDQFGIDSRGFALTNKRLIFIDEKKKVYESASIKELKYQSLYIDNSLVPKIVILGNKITALGKENYLYRMISIVHGVIKELQDEETSQETSEAFPETLQIETTLSDNIFCQSCGEKIERYAKFCNYCGEPNPIFIKECPACGKLIKNDAKFCNFCGTQFV